MDKLFRFLVALTVMAALGCGTEEKKGGGNSDENNAANGSTNNAANNSSADAGNNGVTMEDVDNTGVEYASEYETIFDAIEFQNQPANQLNILVANNLDTSLEFPIIVLLEFTDIDADAGTVVLHGGSGLKTEDPEVFEWDPDAEMDEGTEGTLDPATGEFSASLPYFGFVSTFKFENEVNKTTLPINDLHIEGQLVLEDEGASARVANGYMEGYLTKEDGDDTLITLSPGSDPVTLTEIFKEGTLNYDTTAQMEVEAGSASADAWFIKGNYTAVATDIAD